MSRIRPLWRTVIDALVFVSVLVLVLLVVQLFGQSDIQVEKMQVIDGDSLRDGTTEIRLYGIDAPEYQQKCRDEFRTEYACGKRSATELRQIVGLGKIVCRSIENDRYGRSVSTCMADGMDIAYVMVERGWAVAYTHYGLDYVRVENQARKAKRGLWAGEFENPLEYRNRLRSIQSTVTGVESVEPD